MTREDELQLIERAIANGKLQHLSYPPITPDTPKPLLLSKTKIRRRNERAGSSSNQKFREAAYKTLGIL